MIIAGIISVLLGLIFDRMGFMPADPYLAFTMGVAGMMAAGLWSKS